MAFDLAGKIVLSLDQGSLGKVISEAKQGLSSELGVKVKGPSDLTNRAITALSKKLDVLGNNFIKANASANTFGSTLATLAPKVSNVANSLNVSAVSAVKAKQAILNTAVATKKLGKESEYVTSRVQEFGRQTGITARRFAAFLVSASVFYNFSRALTSGFTEAVAFQKQMIRLEQTTGKTQIQLLGVNRVIDDLAVNFGVSSKALSEIAVTLGQAGLTAKETSDALEVLGKTTLAPTFKDINKTTEGLIAAFRQFKLESKEFKEVFSSINTVAARFAVESEDIVIAIQKAGGVFATLDGEIGEFTKTGGQRLKEFISIFSAVRDTTRESADSIATGLRTIFSRLQRPRTQDFIKDTLGIDLTEIKDGEKVFVGGLEAIKRLNAGLASIKPNSTLFANVVEEIGGIRQSSRVIPLLTQIGKIQQALNASKEDSNSLDKDALTAQKALSVQLDKTKENFFKLFREITSSTSFNILLDGVLKTTNALITMARAFKDIIPLVVAFAGVKLFKNFPTFGQGVGVGLSELVSPKFGKIPTKKAKGGFIPGYGGGDTVPAMLEKGEYVLPKDIARNIGIKKLDKLRGYADGGEVGGNKKKRKLARDAKGRFIKLDDIDVPTSDLNGLLASQSVPDKEKYKIINGLISSNVDRDRAQTPSSGGTDYSGLFSGAPKPVIQLNKYRTKLSNGRFYTPPVLDPYRDPANQPSYRPDFVRTTNQKRLPFISPEQGGPTTALTVFKSKVLDLTKAFDKLGKVVYHYQNDPLNLNQKRLEYKSNGNIPVTSQNFIRTSGAAPYGNQKRIPFVPANQGGPGSFPILPLSSNPIKRLKGPTGKADRPDIVKSGILKFLFGNKSVDLAELKTLSLGQEARQNKGLASNLNYNLRDNKTGKSQEVLRGKLIRGIYEQLKVVASPHIDDDQLLQKATAIGDRQLSGQSNFLKGVNDPRHLNSQFLLQGDNVLGLGGGLGKAAGSTRFAAYRNRSPVLGYLSRVGKQVGGAARTFSNSRYGGFANKVGNSNAALLTSFAGVAGSSALFGSASTGINDKERKRGAIGDSIGGAFAGVGTGATLGTVGGAPGIVIGAVIGGLVGLTSSLLQAKSQIEEARFGELLTELGEKIRVANKGLDKRDTSGTTDVSNFVGKIQYQIAKAERNSNFTTFDDLASDDNKEKARIKVLKNASGSIDELQPFIDKSIDYAIQNKSISADISPSGKNEVLRQFRGLFGGATGRTENLITSARKANGQSFDEDEELFQKIKVASLLSQIKESQNALEFTTNSFLDIANAARDAGESVQKFATDAETLSSVFSGGISGQKFQSFGALSRPGSIDTDLYNSQARRVGGFFGAPGRELSEKVISLNQLERDLPGILEKVKNDITVGGAGADGEGILNRALGGGIGGDFGNYVQDRITAAFPEGKVQRLLEQSSHEAAEQIFSVFRPLQDILDEAAKELEKSFNDFSKGLVDAAGQLAQVGLERDKISPLQLDATRERARQNRTRLSVGDLQSPFNSAQGRLGGANAFSPVALGKELLETQRKLSALGDDPTKQNAQEFVRLSSRAADLQNALKRLTDATARNAGLQEKLAELEADRADRLALAKGFFGSNGAGQANTARGLLLARGAVANPDSAQYLSAKQRQEVIGSLESVGNVNNVFGTGQTGNQLLEQLINQTVGFANLPKNEEGERQAVQAQILENLNQAVVAQQTLVNVLGSINSTFEQKVVAGFDAFLTKLDALISKINTNPVEAVGRSSGGVLFKPNGTDKVPAMLTAGEFVMKKSAVDRIGLSRLRELNAGGYASGGFVKQTRRGSANRIIEKDRVYEDLYGQSIQAMQPKRDSSPVENTVSTTTEQALAENRLRIKRGIFGDRLDERYTEQPKSLADIYNSIPENNINLDKEGKSFVSTSITGRSSIAPSKLTRESIEELRQAYRTRGLKGPALNRAVAAEKKKNFAYVRQFEKQKREENRTAFKKGGFKLSDRNVVSIPDDLANPSRGFGSAKNLNLESQLKNQRKARYALAKEEYDRKNRKTIYRTTRGTAATSGLTDSGFDKSLTDNVGVRFNDLTSTRRDSFARSGRNYNKESLQKNTLDPIIAESKIKKDRADAIPRYRYFPNNYARQSSRRRNEENLDYENIIRKAETKRILSTGLRSDDGLEKRYYARKNKEVGENIFDSRIPYGRFSQRPKNILAAGYASGGLVDEATLARKQRAARVRAGLLNRDSKEARSARYEAARARFDASNRKTIYRNTRDKSTEAINKTSEFSDLNSSRGYGLARSGRNYNRERLEKNELAPIIAASLESKREAEKIPRYQALGASSIRQRSRRRNEENLDYQRIVQRAETRRILSTGLRANDGLENRYRTRKNKENANSIFDSRIAYGRFSQKPTNFLRGTDNVPAMLSNGEFVLNRGATNAVGVDKLKKVNRFAQGGLVGGQNSQGSSVGGGGPNFEAMTKASEQINKSILQFIASSKPLVDALNSFPREVSMKGEHTLQVVINGGEAISKIMPELKSYVEGEIRNSLQKLIKDKFPEVGSNL